MLLLVDTAGATGGIALASGDESGEVKILGCRELHRRAFSLELIPAIQEVLVESGASLAELSAIAVIRGPGSFTGLRVGLGAVKGLAEATGKPVIALSRLAVMASALRFLGDSERDADLVQGDRAQGDLVHAVIDAGRAEYYYGAYRESGWTIVTESVESLETLTSKLRNTPGTVVTFEAAALDILLAFAPRQIPAAGVRQAVTLAWRSWQGGRFADVLTLDANYLRRSDAELFARPATATGKNHIVQR